MTVFFESHQITIYRKRRIGATDRYGMSATFTVHGADIQPASRERTEMVQGRFGSVYDAFIDPNVNIKEGDQIVSGGRRYSVRGVNKWSGAGLLDHQELVLIAVDGS